MEIMDSAKNLIGGGSDLVDGVIDQGADKAKDVIKDQLN